MGEQVVDLEQTIANMTQNQQGLIAQNKELNEVIEKLRSGKDIYSKMLAIKKDLGHVGKDQKNKGQGWMFRGIDQFLNSLKPLLDKHGVGMLTKCHQNAEEFIKNEQTGKTSKNTRIMMEYIFFAEDGSQVSSFIPAEGVDPGDKGTNKALSAALKYCLTQTFTVPTEDMAEGDKDNVTIDGNSGKSSAPKRAASPVKSVDKAPDKKSFRKPKIVDSGDL